jgi:hypothetical protein
MESFGTHCRARTLKASAHQWAEAGFFHALWEKGLTTYDEFRGINWEWEAPDGTNIEAPLARESAGPNPTDRGKKGTKRNMLTDGKEVPLAITIGPANRHDSIFLDELLDKRMELPRKNEDIRKNLCLDARYVGNADVVEKHGMVPHIRPRGEKKKLIEKNSDFIARRWVADACHSRFNRFRKLIPRYEKTDASYISLSELAAAMIAFNKVIPAYG